MVNEKETRAPKGPDSPSQIRDGTCMRKTDQNIQKFEFPALFFHCERKSAFPAKTAENTGQTIHPLVSEKAQANRRQDARTIITASNHRKHRTGGILNDCSTAPTRATSLQAPATWARENRITASVRRSAAASLTFRCRTARP
ncbi:hypothetical protein LJR098_003168 [Rhizobium sp. LjRoot98]